jgi:hypothetical protein
MLRICAFRRPPAGLVENARAYQQGSHLYFPLVYPRVNDSGFEPDTCLLYNSPCISLQR